MLRITTASANRIFVMAAVDERDSFVDLLNPLKDEARRKAGPLATQASAASRVVPPPALQADVFKKHPDLKEVHTRCPPALLARLLVHLQPWSAVRVQDCCLGHLSRLIVLNLHHWRRLPWLRGVPYPWGRNV